MPATLRFPFNNRLNDPGLRLWKSGVGLEDAISGIVHPFTRSSEGMMYDYEGYLRTLPDDCPVINGAKFVQNLWRYSQDFSVGTWTKIGGGTYTDDAYADPMGGNNAASVQNGAGGMYQDNTIPEIADTPITKSFHIRNVGGARYTRIRLLDAATNNNGGEVWYDSVDGVVTHNNTFGSGATLDAYKATNAGGGWVRCELTVTLAAGITTVRCTIANVTGPTSNTTSSAEMAWFGAQLENVGGLSDPSAGPYQVSAATRGEGCGLYAHDALGNAINPRGYLRQRGATNLIADSNIFNSSWTKIVGGTYTDGVVEGPDGKGNSASTIVNGAGGIYRNFTVTADAIHTIILCIKADPQDWMKLRFQENGSSTNWCDAWFNAATQQAGTFDANGAGNATYYGHRAIALANGWTICILRAQLGSGVTAGRILLQNVTTDGASNTDTGQMQYWGCGLFESHTNAMPVETSGGTATRDGDAGVCNDLSFLNADRSIGSWFIDCYGPDWIDSGDNNDDGGLFACYQNSVNVSQQLAIINGADDLKNWSSGGTATSATPIMGGPLDIAARHKVASGWAVDDVNGYMDGAQGSQMPDTSYDYTGGAALTAFVMGKGISGGAARWEGEIGELLYYDERVSDSTLEAWSNGEQLYGTSSAQAGMGFTMGKMGMR